MAPVISEKNDFVDWEFIRSSYQGNSDDEINEGINIPDNHQKVLDVIDEFPTYSAAKIADNLSISIATVERSISWLKAQNIIERVGAKKTGYWQRVG